MTTKPVATLRCHSVKRAARQRRVPYQRMIRALVDAYAEKQEGKG